MKPSTFAIILGVVILMLSPVGILFPRGYLDGFREFVNAGPLVHCVLVTWAVMAVLLLYQPRSSEAFEEGCIRFFAWLILIKSLVLFWRPDVMIWFVDNLPPGLIRWGSIADAAFGLWMFWLAKKMISESSRESVT